MKLPFQWGWIDKDLLSLASDPWDLKQYDSLFLNRLTFFCFLLKAATCCKYMGLFLNGGTQQPWVFLLKMVILGCFGGTTI